MIRGDRPAPKIEVTPEMVDAVENILSSVGQVSITYLAQAACQEVVAQIRRANGLEDNRGETSNP